MTDPANVWAGAPLAPAVIQELERLGADRVDELAISGPVPLEHVPPLPIWDRKSGWTLGGPESRDPVGRLTAIPEPIAFFRCNVWFPNDVFEAAGARRGPMEMSPSGGDGLDDLVDGVRRVLVPVGYSEETYDTYYVDAFDGATDPAIYKADHEGADPARLPLTLSSFLATLVAVPRRRY